MYIYIMWYIHIYHVIHTYIHIHIYIYTTWYIHLYYMIHTYICIHTYMICTDTRDFYIYIYVYTYIHKYHVIHTYMLWKEEIWIQIILFPTLVGLNHRSPPWVGPTDCTRIWGGENMESKASTCVDVLQTAQASIVILRCIACIYIHTPTHNTHMHTPTHSTHTYTDIAKVKISHKVNEAFFAIHYVIHTPIHTTRTHTHPRTIHTCMLT